MDGQQGAVQQGCRQGTSAVGWARGAFLDLQEGSTADSLSQLVHVAPQVRQGPWQETRHETAQGGGTTREGQGLAIDGIANHDRPAPHSAHSGFFRYGGHLTREQVPCLAPCRHVHTRRRPDRTRRRTALRRRRRNDGCRTTTRCGGRTRREVREADAVGRAVRLRRRPPPRHERGFPAPASRPCRFADIDDALLGPPTASPTSQCRPARRATPDRLRDRSLGRRSPAHHRDRPCLPGHRDEPGNRRHQPIPFRAHAVGARFACGPRDRAARRADQRFLCRGHR